MSLPRVLGVTKFSQEILGHYPRADVSKIATATAQRRFLEWVNGHNVVTHSVDLKRDT